MKTLKIFARWMPLLWLNLVLGGVPLVEHGLHRFLVLGGRVAFGGSGQGFGSRVADLVARFELSDAEIARQVDRMLADARSARFAESFVALWIGFTAFDQIAIDPNYYPNWRPSLKSHAKQECVAFFQELLRTNESCLNLLDSEFVMVNQRMAEHYGMTGVDGMNF